MEAPRAAAKSVAWFTWLKITGIALAAVILMFSLFPRPGNLYTNLSELGQADDGPELDASIVKSDEFEEFFADGIASLSRLDSDRDGIADIDDDDDDNDGIPDATDSDDDGDGTPDESDPSSAFIGALPFLDDLDRSRHHSTTRYATGSAR